MSHPSAARTLRNAGRALAVAGLLLAAGSAADLAAYAGTTTGVTDAAQQEGDAPRESAPSDAAPATSTERASNDPVESGLEETADVQLVEIKVTVTDRRGRAIRDIAPEEVEVFERGKRQRLAYWSHASTAELVNTAQAVTPTPLYDRDGEAHTAEAEAVLPAEPVRRVILAFDPKNSRLRAREQWREAAIEWVREHREPGDRIGVVVVRTHPDWIVASTTDPDEAVAALSQADLHTDIPNRSRRNEMTEYVETLRSTCWDNVGRGLDSGNTGPGRRGADVTGNEIGCAFEFAKSLVAEWGVQTEESIDTLQALTGELASIPGDKVVVLFSEGIVQSPDDVLINAMLHVFTYDKVDIPAMKSRLDRNRFADMTQLHRTAIAADVSYFTIDTRHANEGSNFSELEQASAGTTGMLGINPWQEMYDSTRGTLAALAHATGGKPFYGPDDLTDKIRTAAERFHGIYTLGYYRSEPYLDRGKVRVDVKRPKVRAEYDKRPDPRRHQPGFADLDVTIGRPAPSLSGSGHAIPIALTTPLDRLPLRRGGGGHGCEVGVFVQAISPDGTILSESFELVTVVLDDKQFRERLGQKWLHMVQLDVPEGPLRIRSRLSDDRHAVLADRAVDLTLEGGRVHAGHLPVGDDAADTDDAESGENAGGAASGDASTSAAGAGATR